MMQQSTQLEIGITPLSLELKEGLKVAFFVGINQWRHKKRRKRKEVHIGVVKRFSSSGVVIEGITINGLYNRAPEGLFEVYKDMILESWGNQ